KKVWDKLTQPERSDLWFEQFFRALPETFVTTVEPTAIAETLRRFRNLEEGTGSVTGHYIAGSKTVEFVAGISRGVGRGIFSAMAGVLSARGMSIVAGETAGLN